MLAFKLENFIDTHSLDRLADLYDQMNEKRLTVKDTGINYRMINHWDTMDIIHFGRNNKEGNRKFSFADFIWIKVVNELRSFGVKLPVIKKIAQEIYEPIPLKEIMHSFAQHSQALDQYYGKNKAELLKFIKSGAYKTADLRSDQELNYMQVLMIEAIGIGNLVSLIVFDDGEWFPYIKSQEPHYPKELLAKKEMRSQIRISITDIIYRFIVEDALKEYCQIFQLFDSKEDKLISDIKAGDYKQLDIRFKSKERESIEIKRSKTALTDLVNIIREKDYKEIILTDKMGKEFRVKAEPEDTPTLLKQREEIFANMDAISAESKGKAKSKSVRVKK